MRIQRILPPILFLLLILCQAACLAKDKDKLLIVTDSWPPYVFQENGVTTGFDYEIMMAVFGNMGYRIDLKFLPWKRCIQLMKLRQADGILDIGKNEDRTNFMYFPDEHLSESSSVLFHQKDRAFTFDGLEDLTGLTIGTILGYKYNREFLGAVFFTREPVKTEEQNFQKLLLGRIDLLLTNKNVGLYIAKTEGVLERVAYLPKPLSGGNNYLAFATKPGHAKLAEEFSRYLAEFKKTGEFHEIVRRYGQ